MSSPNFRQVASICHADVVAFLEAIDVFSFETCSTVPCEASRSLPDFVWRDAYKQWFRNDPIVHWEPSLSWRERCLGRLALPRAVRIVPNQGALGLKLGSPCPPLTQVLEQSDYGALCLLRVPVQVPLGSRSLSCTLELRVANEIYAWCQPGWGTYDVMVHFSETEPDAVLTYLGVATPLAPLDALGARGLCAGDRLHSLLKMTGAKEEDCTDLFFGFRGNSSDMFKLPQVPEVNQFESCRYADGQRLEAPVICSIHIGEVD